MKNRIIEPPTYISGVLINKVQIESILCALNEEFVILDDDSIEIIVHNEDYGLKSPTFSHEMFCTRLVTLVNRVCGVPEYFLLYGGDKNLSDGFTQLYRFCLESMKHNLKYGQFVANECIYSKILDYPIMLDLN